MIAEVDRFTAEDFEAIYDEEYEQAQRLGEILIDYYEPDTVLDVGCATGLYLEPFFNYGSYTLGVEPELAEAAKAGLRIPRDRMVKDIQTVPDDDRFDLTLCLEVAEHIPESQATKFIQDICDRSTVVIFSAAQPGQGGKGHINCQPKAYWEKMFASCGFKPALGATEHIVRVMKEGPHMGWLVNNLMILGRVTSPKLVQDEVMNVDPNTGGRKASKPSRIGFIDPQALITLGEVAGMGAEKYEKYNYLKGFDWSLCYNAMMRHAQAAWSGEDLDPESGLPHMAHAAWQALALTSFYQRGIGNDDRPSAFLSHDTTYSKGEQE